MDLTPDHPDFERMLGTGDFLYACNYQVFTKRAILIESMKAVGAPHVEIAGYLVAFPIIDKVREIFPGPIHLSPSLSPNPIHPHAWRMPNSEYVLKFISRQRFGDAHHTHPGFLSYAQVVTVSLAINAPTYGLSDPTPITNHQWETIDELPVTKTVLFADDSDIWSLLTMADRSYGTLLSSPRMSCVIAHFKQKKREAYYKRLGGVPFPYNSVNPYWRADKSDNVHYQYTPLHYPRETYPPFFCSDTRAWAELLSSDEGILDSYGLLDLKYRFNMLVNHILENEA